jgi:hypothetical protein
VAFHSATSLCEPRRKLLCLAKDATNYTGLGTRGNEVYAGTTVYSPLAACLYVRRSWCGDHLDFTFLDHAATGVSGFISYDFSKLAGRDPRPSFTFFFQGVSMRRFVSSIIDLGSRLR